VRVTEDAIQILADDEPIVVSYERSEGRCNGMVS
jgi:hypothetical protein